MGAGGPCGQHFRWRRAPPHRGLRTGLARAPTPFGFIATVGCAGRVGGRCASQGWRPPAAGTGQFTAGLADWAHRALIWRVKGEGAMNRIVLGGFVMLLLIGIGLFWLQGRAEVERGASSRTVARSGANRSAERRRDGPARARAPRSDRAQPRGAALLSLRSKPRSPNYPGRDALHPHRRFP